MRTNIPLRNDLKERLDQISEQTGISVTTLIVMATEWLVKNYESELFFKNLLIMPDNRSDFEPYLTGVSYDDAINKLERAGETDAIKFLKSWTSDDGYTKRGWDSMTKNLEGEFVQRFGKRVCNIIWRYE
ncbi:hypothetical protein [Paenibacillus sp. P46E]|uniref:hypothetical protein n=1 Tax=Paenibacillus sp. P46E TaxID=1349436 RepID=UPI00093DF919|nr:hypothetical protein [Paenibacillus sp. P46E]OKP98630.1 hypothetical protein A3849_08875 [Paenibacillus sp. P46E]